MNNFIFLLDYFTIGSISTDSKKITDSSVKVYIYGQKEKIKREKTQGTGAESG